MPIPLETIADLVQESVTTDAVEMAKAKIERLDQIGLEDDVPDGYVDSAQYKINAEPTEDTLSGPRLQLSQS